MSEVKEVTLKATTEEMRERFAKGLHIDAKTGVGKFAEDAYIKSLDIALPAPLVEKFPGIVEELPNIIKHIGNHNATVAAGAGYAFGQASEKFIAKHKDFTRTEAELPTTGKDGFEFVYDRERTVPSRNADGTTGTKTAHGMLRVGYRTYHSESVGELKKAKSLLSASGANVFGG